MFVPGGDDDAGSVAKRAANLRATLVLKPVNAAVEEDASTPRFCVEFTDPLSKARQYHYEDFVQTKPAARLTITARDNKLCAEGIEWGQTYRVTVRAVGGRVRLLAQGQAESIKLRADATAESIRTLAAALEAKEGLTLLNGTQHMTAIGALTVLDAEGELSRLRVDLVQARIDQRLSSAQLRRALGTLERGTP